MKLLQPASELKEIGLASATINSAHDGAGEGGGGGGGCDHLIYISHTYGTLITLSTSGSIVH